MKLIFTSDLHAPADGTPYRQLGELARARGATLVAVAGDLLDLFARGYPGTQVHSAAGWLRTLASQVPHLAVCSGNHDPDGPNGAGWLTRAVAGVKAGNLVVDGGHAVLRGGGDDPGLLVSRCPHWDVQERGVTHHLWLRDRAERVWAAGRARADQHPGLPWVVLHHEPPAGTSVAAGAARTGEDFGDGAFWAAEWCRRYRPDYLLCGHLHHSPFVAGGSWADRVPGTDTWAFNPGRDDGTRQSGLVEVDATARVARWFPPGAGEPEEVRALDERRSAAGDGPGRAATDPDAGPWDQSGSDCRPPPALPR